METLVEKKLFLLQLLEDHLHAFGLNGVLTDIITFLTACALMVLLFWMLELLGSRSIKTIIHLVNKHTETQWSDVLIHQKFFARLIRLILGGVLLVSAHFIFTGYGNFLITGVELTSKIFIVVMIALVFSSFMNSANELYNSRPIAQQKSIKGFVQTAKVIVYVMSGVVIIAILLNKNPSQLFLGLGASAAILTLVFKDTVLGFIASIQISAQDMIRPGDWIEMSSKGADGVVIDINVSNVKVRNWNNTITMIPIYLLVSDAFTNWRSLEESGGRLFKRSITIDISTMHELSAEEITLLTQHPYIAPVAKSMMLIEKATNQSQFTINLGLFRCYTEAYMRNHPKIAHDLPLTVRYVTIGENGVLMELYGYSTEKKFENFEAVACDLLNHTIRMASLFGLNPYQRPGTSPPNPPTPQSGTPTPINLGHS